MTKPVRILHTADWHLGRSLYQKNRFAEFERFLNWLIDALKSQSVDVLLVAGDIFDTSNPSNSVQGLYYNFLVKVSETNCRHVVITSGNHDSPSLLDVPREILKRMNIHVVGDLPDRIEDEVIVLRDPMGEPELIVCAVPYLRDRDIRKSEPGEAIEDKEQKLREGIRLHYARVGNAALAELEKLQSRVPIVAMGHLFTAGGETVEGDGVRNLYVGNLGHVESSVFPSYFQYVALGHLHVPQKVNGSETIRFSGSPIPMGFGEAKQQKYVNLIECSVVGIKVEMVPIPKLQALQCVSGDWPRIESQVSVLKSEEESVWLEVCYEGDEVIGGLKDRINALVEGSLIEVLKVTNTSSAKGILKRTSESETLENLTPTEVFQRYLEARQVPSENRPKLLTAFDELLIQMHQADLNAQ